MSDNVDTLQQDIGWLRALAESGQNAPLQAGPYLVAGGAWFGGASLFLGLQQLGVASPVAATMPWIWLVAAIGFGTTLALLIRRDREQVERGPNRLINATWSAAGFGIFVYWAASSILATRLDNAVVMATMAPAVMVIYGLVWWIKGSLTGSAWMRGLALISFASVFLVALAMGSPFAWLTYSVALLATALLPGLHLMRQARRAP